MNFVIFDMDGVLVDTSPCHARAFADLWQRYGVDGPAYASIAGRPTREVVAAYTAAIEEWTEFKQSRAREYIRTEPLAFPDVLPCLEALRRAGIGMGVATGASRENAYLTLSIAGIEPFFQYVLTADDIRHGKPHPEIYLRATGLAYPARSIVVEDSVAGLASAAAAGVPAACVRTGLNDASPLFWGSYSSLADFARSLGVEV